jgi:hypothetical protein
MLRLPDCESFVPGDLSRADVSPDTRLHQRIAYYEYHDIDANTLNRLTDKEILPQLSIETNVDRINYEGNLFESYSY